MAEQIELVNSEPLIVGPDAAKSRVDAYISKNLPDLSRSKVQALIEQGLVRVNDKVVKASHKLNAGDSVTISDDLSVPEEDQREFVIDILFEDDDVLVLNKPTGLAVHAGSGVRGKSLTELLLQQGKTLSRLVPDRPGIVHRLDKGTSGVLVCAKNDLAHAALSRQFAKKTNYRQYCALLDGIPAQKNFAIETMIARDPKDRRRMRAFPVNPKREESDIVLGKWARSHFAVERTYGKRLSLVNVQLETGRMHQIRVHALQVKTPVWADPVYKTRTTDLPAIFDGPVRDALLSLDHQLLHARYLGFEHPTTHEKLAFEAPLPADFAQVLQMLEPWQDPTPKE